MSLEERLGEEKIETSLLQKLREFFEGFFSKRNLAAYSLASLIALGAAYCGGNSNNTSAGCRSDADCKGDRICNVSSGECGYPTGNGGLSTDGGAGYDGGMATDCGGRCGDGFSCLSGDCVKNYWENCDINGKDVCIGNTVKECEQEGQGYMIVFDCSKYGTTCGLTETEGYDCMSCGTVTETPICDGDLIMRCGNGIMYWQSCKSQGANYACVNGGCL